MLVTIFTPARSATQSGLGRENIWKLKFPCDDSKYHYELMNWSGSKNPCSQLDLTFPNKESAINFAESRGFDYKVIEPQTKLVRKKAYADNFK